MVWLIGNIYGYKDPYQPNHQSTIDSFIESGSISTPILEQESQKNEWRVLRGFGAFFTVICVLLPRLSLNLYELRPMIYLDLFFGSPDFHRLFFPTPLRVARVDNMDGWFIPLDLAQTIGGPAPKGPHCVASQSLSINGICWSPVLGGNQHSQWKLVFFQKGIKRYNYGIMLQKGHPGWMSK